MKRFISAILEMNINKVILKGTNHTSLMDSRILERIITKIYLSNKRVNMSRFGAYDYNVLAKSIFSKDSISISKQIQ